MHNFHKLSFYIILFFIFLSIIKPKNIISSQNSNSDINYDLSSFIEPNENAKKFVQPVVKLNFEVDSGTSQQRIVASSTGVSIAYDRKSDKSYILTNNHFCIEESDFPLAGRFFYEKSSTLMSSEIQFESGDAKIINLDADKDLCLMELDGFVKPAHLVSTTYQVKQMDLAITVGSPAGIFPIIRTTYISNFYSRDVFPDSMALGENLLLLSDLVFPGQSGSPVFNKHGEIVGLICVSLSNRDGYVYGGIAIPHQDLRMFLNKNGIN